MGGSLDYFVIIGHPGGVSGCPVTLIMCHIGGGVLLTSFATM